MAMTGEQRGYFYRAPGFMLMDRPGGIKTIDTRLDPPEDQIWALSEGFCPNCKKRLSVEFPHDKHFWFPAARLKGTEMKVLVSGDCRDEEICWSLWSDKFVSMVTFEEGEFDATV